jgi:hypothetical protein
VSEERNSSVTLAMRSSRQKPSLKTIKYGSMLGNRDNMVSEGQTILSIHNQEQ